MLYTKQIVKALNIAYDAHNGQLDKGGVPYIFHPYYIAIKMDSEDEIITAILHDVVEDTEVTMDDLYNMGFKKEVIDALKLLTHRKDVEYMDYIKNISNNNIARKVKLADLEHNSDISRIDKKSKKDYDRLDKYKKAIEYLKASCN